MVQADGSRPFRGPLFIVGLSRSGTTLLRELLNQHSKVSLHPTESRFIPKLFERFGRDPCMDTRVRKAALASYILHVAFVQTGGKGDAGFDEEQFIREADFGSWQSILEYVFRKKPPETVGMDTIWGDKTPTYLRYLPLLKSRLPEAKFIHIIRDVRDRTLSVRRTWKKSRLRSAYQWVTELEQAVDYRERYPGDYLEVYYEELLQNSRETLQKICRFLGIDFEEDMLQLARPVTYFGNAQGRLDIKSDNLGNYEQKMSMRTIRRVEEIAYPMMVAHGYIPKHAMRHRPLGRWHLACLRVADRLKLVWFNMKYHGPVRGIQFSFQVWKVDSVTLDKEDPS